MSTDDFSSAKVVIVGAGAAGLYAAQRLQKQGIQDVILVDSMPYIGGRILTYATPDNVSVDLGGEFVHGDIQNPIVDMARENNWEMQHVFDIEDGKGSFYVSNGKLVAFDSEMAQEVDEVFASLQPSEQSSSTSIYQYLLESKPVKPSVLPLFNSYLGATWAASLATLGVKESLEEERLWVHGSANYVLKGGFQKIVDHLKQGLNIRLGWKVQSINYGQSPIVVTNEQGSVITCQRVIVTVPLPILQDGDIDFHPPLPATKVQALKRMKMGHAVKVVGTFTRKFWPEGMQLLLTDHPMFPQIWMTHDEPEKGLYIVVGYMSGSAAGLADNESRPTIISLFVQYLDTIFADKKASSCFKRGMVHSWDRHPGVRGAYCYPSIGSAGCRKIMSEPIGDRIFFAGEAYNVRSCGNVHSAMEAGEVAAIAVGQSLTRSKL